MIGVSRRAATPGPGAAHIACDLTDPDATAALIGRVAPDVIVHTQALSDVDACERDPAEAHRQNVEATAHLCRAIDGRSTVLLGLSTDYVFDGAKTTPYDEDDAPRPLSVYGRTKVESEALVRRHPFGFVARVSTLFGPDRKNFCGETARRLAAGEPVEAHTDQVTSPSYTEDVAEALAALLAALPQQQWSELPRVYHVTNAGSCRRLDLVTRVAQELGASLELVRPIQMAAQGRPARRPSYSAMTSRHLARLTERMIRGWQEALHVYLQQARWLDSPSGSPTRPRASASSA